MTSNPADPSPGRPLGERIRARLDSGDLSIPLFPESAARVLQACDDPDGDAACIATLIEADPALAANLLRVANSAAYAPTDPIVSLQQAVSRLGMQTVACIVTAVALRSEVFHVEGFEPTLQRLWLHSARAGAWAKEVARLRRKSVEAAFLCGLLHDIGKPVVLQAAVDIAGEEGIDLDEVVLHEVLGDLHAEVAGRILSEWEMPGWVQAAARHHHEARDAGEYRDEVLMTSLANLLAHLMEEEEFDRDVVRGDPVLVELGLYADELGPLFDRLEEVEKLAEAIG